MKSSPVKAKAFDYLNSLLVIIVASAYLRTRCIIIIPNPLHVPSASASSGSLISVVAIVD